MKIKDYLKNKFEIPEKLVTAKSLVVKKVADNKIVCEQIIIAHHIENGQCVLQVKPSGQINLDTVLLQDITRLGSLISIGATTGGIICISNNGDVTIPNYLHGVCTVAQRSDIDKETSDFLEASANEVEKILTIIPQITSYKTNTSSYASRNAQISREVNDNNRMATDFNNETNRLMQQANGFQIEDTIRSFNLRQKAHILQKVWAQNDPESVSIIDVVKRCGFEPHYAGLVQLALNSNDAPLFDLLIASGVDFNNCLQGNSIFQLVLATNNNNLIDKMFATSTDFSKAVLNIALRDEEIILAKAFSCKPELAKTIYSGYPLLQLALKNNDYKAAEEILKIDNGYAAKQLSHNNLSALQLMLLRDNQQGVELLKRLGVDFVAELKNAVANKKLTILDKLLTASPGLINETYDNLPLGHFVVQNGDRELLSKVLEKDHNLADRVDNQGRNLLYFALDQHKPLLAEMLLEYGVKDSILKALAEDNIQIIRDLIGLKPTITELDMVGNKSLLYLALEQNKTPVTELVLNTSDLLSTIKIAMLNNQTDIALKLIHLTPNILNELTKTEENVISQQLLQHSEFGTVCNKEGNSWLHLSIQHGNKTLTESLLQNYPNLLDKQNLEHNTALHILLKGSLEISQKTDLAAIVLSHHPRVDLQDLESHTVVELTETYPSILAMFYENDLLGVDHVTD